MRISALVLVTCVAACETANPLPVAGRSDAAVDIGLEPFDGTGTTGEVDGAEPDAELATDSAPDAAPAAEEARALEPDMGTGDGPLLEAHEVRPGAPQDVASPDVYLSSTLPVACTVLSVYGTSARPRCKGTWPGSQYPCFYYCQPSPGVTAVLPDQDTLWACRTFTPDSHDNAGQVVCVGGGVVGCNTYCPANR